MSDWTGAGRAPDRPSPSRRPQAAAQPDIAAEEQFRLEVVRAAGRMPGNWLAWAYSPSASNCHDDHYRNVVAAASRICRHHQFPRCTSWIGMPPQDFVNLLVFHVRRHAIAAQQQPIATLEP